MREDAAIEEGECEVEREADGWDDFCAESGAIGSKASAAIIAKNGTERALLDGGDERRQIMGDAAGVGAVAANGLLGGGEDGVRQY